MVNTVNLVTAKYRNLPEKEVHTIKLPTAL